MAADEQTEYDGPDDQPSHFGALFDRPSLSEIYGLGADGLEAFAQYVFECAGYAVKHVGKQSYPFGPGVDLDLYQGPVTGTPVLRVEVRCYSPDPPAKLIDADAVMAFIGKLQLAGNVPGVMVTTSDYTGPARLAGIQGHVTLLDGKRFLRYITYLRGSRLTGAHAPLARNFKLPPVPPSCLLDAEATPRRDPKSSTVLAVANNKGGVAKTTSAIVLAQLLATKHQQNVLVIDMDGQASLTAALPGPGPVPPARPPDDTVHLSDFFAGRRTFLSLVRKSRFERLWVVPAHERLLVLDSGGAGRPDDELQFVRAVHDLDLTAPDGSEFDWIILDTPPAQSFYTRAALAASHYVVIPVNAEAFSARGVTRAYNTADTMRALMGRGADVLGCFVTRWTDSAEAKRAWSDLQDIVNARGGRRFATKVRADFRVGRLTERVQGGFLAFLWPVRGDGGPAATDYEALLKEILHDVHRD